MPKLRKIAWLLPARRLVRPLVPLLVAALVAALAAHAAAAPPELPAIGAKDRQAIVAKIIGALDDAYVFPEVARKMGARLRQQLGSGAYNRLTTLPAFAEQLTEDLQGVSHDRHLQVGVGKLPESEETTPEERARVEAGMRRDNYCFREVKHLPGNVGYLKLDCFERANLAGSTAVAAMGFLAGSDALIFDLRDNTGGHESMVELLASYLLPGETLLESFYARKGDVTGQSITQAWVPGSRLTEVPVYVLTSSRTFSAAESFAYSLQSLKRATIVGETTAGAANTVAAYQVEKYPVLVALPNERPVNPVTGGNWEGTGVAPDVAAAVGEALAVAHSRALAAIAGKATDPEVKAGAELVRQILDGRRHPVTLPAKDLAAFVGTYSGPRQVTLEDGILYYQRAGAPKWRLLPIGNDKFLVGDLDDRLMRFERDPSGKVVRIVGVFTSGNEEPNERRE